MSAQRGFCQYLPSNKKNPILKTPSQDTTHHVKQKQFITSSTVCQSSSKKTEKKSQASHRKIDWWSVEQSKPTIDTTTYNILHIDSKIKDILSANISSLPELQKGLNKLLFIYQHNKDPAQKIIAKQQAALLRKRIQDIESTIELSFYIFRTHDLIQEYRELVKKSGTRNFVTNHLDKNVEVEDRINRIISRYLTIAQDYVNIENIPQKPIKLTCTSCKSYNLKQSKDDESIFICDDCHSEIEILDDSPNFKDTDRVNMSSKYTYTRKGHFIDAAKRFQGTQNIDPKKIQEAVSIIEKEMKLHDLVKDRNTPHSVTKDQIYMFLSEQDLSSFYEDLNLIFHIITKEPCPDITDYLDGIYEDFDCLEGALKDLQDEERTNSLNVNYKLYKLLQRRGYSCRKDDFYILKTKTKEDEHDEKMKQAFLLLGWQWYPTF